MCVCVTASLCCTAETVTVLQLKIKKKRGLLNFAFKLMISQRRINSGLHERSILVTQEGVRSFPPGLSQVVVGGKRRERG